MPADSKVWNRFFPALMCFPGKAVQYAGQFCRRCDCTSPGSHESIFHFAAWDVQLEQKSIAEGSRLRQFRLIIWYSTIWVCSSQARVLTKHYQAKRRCARWSMYLRAVCLSQRLIILLSISLELTRVVSDSCNDCSFELLHLAAGLGLTGGCHPVLSF